MDSIALALQNIKAKSVSEKAKAKEFASENPLTRTKRVIQQQIAESWKYRISILQNVSSFVNVGMSQVFLISAAQSLEEEVFQKGDVIIRQDDIGDTFYILEEGLVSVRKSATGAASGRDWIENSKELGRLGKDSYFGDAALLTGEPRNASIIVLSETARCLKMTKGKFDEIIAESRKVMAANKDIIIQGAVNQLSFFRSLSQANKRRIIEAMTVAQFPINSYICRQGAPGHSFFILTEGECKVTVNTDDTEEREVARLYAGEFFGEKALLEDSNTRTANVITTTPCMCMVLSRNDFEKLLQSIRTLFSDQSNAKGYTLSKGHSLMHHSHHSAGAVDADIIKKDTQRMRAFKRRITSFDLNGHHSNQLAVNLLKRFGRFAAESLWNSLYSRMYREMKLIPSKIDEYGKHAIRIMKDNLPRNPSVDAITNNARRILEMDESRRNSADNAFVVGLMSQKNSLHELFCSSWPQYQYTELCKKIRFTRVQPLRKIFEAGSKGTTAFLILRGCVRIFTRMARTADSSAVMPLKFDEDLYPGEIFAEGALEGIHTRLVTAQAMTSCDLVIIECEDFISVQDKASRKMSVEDKYQFLSEIPLFKGWEPFKLYKVAHELVQKEFDKGAVMVRRGETSHNMFFLLHGRVDIFFNLQKKTTITSIQKFGYFGESGLISAKFRSFSKVVEECYGVCMTRSDMLVLPSEYVHLIEDSTLTVMRNSFYAKNAWRKERAEAITINRKLFKQEKVDPDMPAPVKHHKAGGHTHVHHDKTESPGAHSRSASPDLQASRSPSPVGRELLNGTTAGTLSLPALVNGNGDNVPPGAGRPVSAHARTGAPGHLGVYNPDENLPFEYAPASAVPGLRRLWEIDDIPAIVDQDLNPMMALPTCKTPKQSDRILNTITDICRPKSARLRANSARKRKDAGFTEAINTSAAEYLMPGTKDPLLCKVHSTRSEMIHQAVLGEREMRLGSLLPIQRLSESSRAQIDRIAQDPANLHGSLRIPTALSYGGFQFDAVSALGASDKIPQLLRARVEAKLEIERMKSKKLGDSTIVATSPNDTLATAPDNDNGKSRKDSSGTSSRLIAHTQVTTVADIMNSVKASTRSTQISGKLTSGRAPSSMGKLY